MESRVSKFSNNNIPSRSARNARLYKEVYGKYDDLNNLPLEDNTDEIDMKKLQEILRKNNSKTTTEPSREVNIIEKRKRTMDDQKVYDINKILEKAKYENNKLKNPESTKKIDTSILSTLQSREISVEELNDLYKNNQKAKNIEKDLSMTRELKFKELSEEVEKNPLMEHVMPNNDLSLELFENLKPTENTIITKPIKSKDAKIETTKNQKEEIDVHSGDIRDIDIIKLPQTTEPNNNENDFFTSTYEFSDKDFMDGSKKSFGIMKIILLFLAIVIFAGAIAYFVINYGIGA